MYKIAICDDENFMCSQIENDLFRYAIENNLNLNIETFWKGEELIESMEQGDYYDVIFLDIKLKTMSGLDIAKKIRDEYENDETQIIYISSNSSYAIQLFKTRPTDFLVKPINSLDILKVFALAIDKIDKGNKLFVFTSGWNYIRMPYKEILYFHSIGRKIIMKLYNNEIEFYGKLDEISKYISTVKFYQIHKSYLINFNNVVLYTTDAVVMKNGESIPISHAKRKWVKEQILERMKEEKDESY